MIYDLKAKAKIKAIHRDEGDKGDKSKDYLNR